MIIFSYKNISSVSVLKPVNYTGIVKFKGKLNPEKYDARIHVGLRMDEQGKIYCFEFFLFQW